LGRLAPDRLSALRHVAAIESAGSSTRIEGAKLSDREVERLLSHIEIKSFATRDEQEVAGYAEAMEMVSKSFDAITLTENHIMAGIKTSAVINVGMATIAAFIGYGERIVIGLALNDNAMFLACAFPAAVLALLIGGAFRVGKRYAMPAGVRRSK
jgi:hypothetical protein